jgi:hypothetical protein
MVFSLLDKNIGGASQRLMGVLFYALSIAVDSRQYSQNNAQTQDNMVGKTQRPTTNS